MAGEPVKLFISYSHKDEALWNELATHLNILKRQGTIAIWYDRKIGAGTEWANQIDDNLREADIILLLISSYFIASDYCYDIELELAMKRHEAGEALVVPIILRPVDWSGAPFGKLQAFPKDAKAITTWDNQHEAFVNVTKGIRQAAKLLLEQRQQKLEQEETVRRGYQKKVEEVLSDGEISIPERDTLDELRQELGLTSEEAEEIEDLAFEPYQRYKENLQKYKQTLIKVIQNEYPFRARTKEDLKLRQRDLGIKAKDVEQIEQPILAQAEAQYREKLKEEQPERAGQQEAERVKQLERQKQREQKEYENKLRRYEQEFDKAIEREYPLLDDVRNELKTFQQSLGLRDEDIERIEKPILEQKEAEYQEQLAEKLGQKQEASRRQRQREQAEYQPILESEKLKQEEEERLRLEVERRRQQEAERDDLSSEAGVDYTRLRDLLKAGKWKEADSETTRVMLKAADREWLNYDDLEKFPCIDLCTLDRLWTKYSDGHFGFSVQKRLWLSVGGKVDYETECRLGDLVGWRENEKWVSYDNLTFDIKAKEGHLPEQWLEISRRKWRKVEPVLTEPGSPLMYVRGFRENVGMGASSLAQRLVTCSATR